MNGVRTASRGPFETDDLRYRCLPVGLAYGFTIGILPILRDLPRLSG